MSDRPNILLIQSDQHRFDCLGRSGHPQAHTPHLDRLAGEGVWFTHAFTPIPTCCPARQSLLSGLWPEQHGGLWNYDITLPVGLFESPAWTTTLAGSGYRLGYVGKWHVHPDRTPLDYGFHDYVSVQDYGTWRRAEGLPAYEPVGAAVLGPAGGADGAGVAARWFGGRDPVPVEQARTHWHAERAIDLIGRYAREGQPWHLRLDFDEPHLPCYATDTFLACVDPHEVAPWGSFGEDFGRKPYIQEQQLHTWGIAHLGWDSWAQYVARYLAVIAQVDDAIGRVLEALDRLGVADSTMVVYTSDHGDACGSHRMIDKHYVMYDDIVRVPLIVRWPGVARAGSTCDAMVTHALDLAVTLCDASGIDAPPGCQGRSLVPWLEGAVPYDWRTEVVSTFNGAQFGLYVQRMLRGDRFKYVWNPTDTDELYDLVSDPWEMRNLVGDAGAQDTLAAMRHRLLERLVAQSDRIVAAPWLREQLISGRKLGPR
jgi:arylsulfatase A-like enzyme